MKLVFASIFENLELHIDLDKNDRHTFFSEDIVVLESSYCNRSVFKNVLGDILNEVYVEYRYCTTKIEFVYVFGNYRHADFTIFEIFETILGSIGNI